MELLLIGLLIILLIWGCNELYKLYIAWVTSLLKEEDDTPLKSPITRNRIDFRTKKEKERDNFILTIVLMTLLSIIIYVIFKKKK